MTKLTEAYMTLRLYWTLLSTRYWAERLLRQNRLIALGKAVEGAAEFYRVTNGKMTEYEWKWREL